MKKSILIKLLVLAVCAAMLLSLVACGGGAEEKESTTPSQSESETTPGGESESKPGSETTPGTGDATEPGTGDATEPGTGDATEPGTGDATEPGTGDATEPGTGDATEPGTGDATEPGTGDATEPGTGDATEPGTGDATEPGTESDTEPGPTCDGNHPIKNRGDQGHYVDACEICGTSRGQVEAHTYEDKEGKPTCSVCGYVASCQGTHAWLNDAEGHWTEACFICGAAAVEKAEHNMDHVDGNYACTVCGYTETCDGNHALVSDGEAGHHEVACVICNTTDGETVPHAFEDKDGSRFCACGYEAACKGVHGWTSDAEGHQMAACDVCGAAATEKAPHSEKLVENLTETAFTYGCADCGYAVYTKALTDKVTAFITPSNMHYNKGDATKNDLSSSTKYQLLTSIAQAEGGMPYITMSSADAVSQFIWNRATAKVGGRSEYEEYTFDVGQAKYLIIKARAAMAETSIIRLNLATVGASTYQNIQLPLVTATENAEWVTYVVDLESAYNTYVKAEGADNYVIDTFYFHMQPFTTEDVLDIAYMAFVEGEWADVAANVEEETVIAVSASNLGAEVSTETGLCIGNHAYNVRVVDGVYMSVCACGDIAHSYNVKAEAVNKFFSAEIIAGKGGMNGSMDLTLTYDETDAFVRIDNCKVNADNWFGFTPVTWESGNFGQYMVMKFRIGENGLNQSFLQIYTHTVASMNAGINWPAGNLKFRVVEDNQWHYIVIDMAACVPAGAWQADANGNYTPNYFQFRPFASNQKNAQADDYMDIAYIAFFDSLDDVKDIVDAETYEWCVDDSTNGLRNTADNSCAQHAIAEKVEGTTHTIKCTLCGEMFRTFEVSADINWYAPLSGMNKYQHTIDKLIYDEEEGLMFNRFTGVGGNHLNLTGGGAAGSLTSGKFVTGKYIAVKYRATSTDTISFNIATGDKKSGNGSSIVKAQVVANQPGNEWRVAIIDVSGNAQWTSDGSEQQIYMMWTVSGTYTVDIAWVAVVDSIDEMKTLLQEGETYFDLGTSWDGTPTQYNQDGTKVPCPEGKHNITEAVAGTDDNGNTTYTYVCAACDTTVQVATVSSAVTKYYTPNAITSDAKQYFSITNNGTMKVTGEDALAYASLNNYRQLIYMRSDADMGGQQEAAPEQYGTMNVGDAKYVVVKFRSGDANAWLQLSLSFEGYNGKVNVATENLAGYHKPDGSKDQWEVDGTTVKGVLAGNEAVVQNGYKSVRLLQKGTADGEWITAVIDLEKACGEVYSKAEGAEDYIVDYFVVDHEGAIDFSYIAFVEGDWTDVDALVDENTVKYVYAAEGDSETRYADGALLGTKAEEPIDIVFDEWGMATVTVPAKTTFYYSTWMLSGEMSLSANGEPIEFVAGSPRRTPSTFSITNDGEEAMEYYLVAEYPAGHMNNPANLWVGEDSVVEIPAGCQGYFFTYEAYATGTLTLKFSATTGWTYTINNITAGIYGDAQYSDSNPVVDTVVIEVQSGEVYQIIINTYDPANKWSAPEGTFTVSAELEIPYGSVDNPVQLNENTTVTIPAGATYHFSSRANGATLFVNGEDNGVIEASMWAPYTFTITNESEADAEYVFAVVFPEGTMDNPKEIVTGENSVEIAEGAQQPYFYTWTAPAAGKFTITVSSSTGWFYVVNNLTSYQYGDSQWSDSDPVVATWTVDVAEGDVLEIQVNTYDPANQWSAPAGTVTVTAAFEEASNVITTIAGALAGEVGAEVEITGTVSEMYQGWNTQYNNCSPYIVDAEGNKIIVFRCTENVAIGDVITVVGVIDAYNNVNQIAQGSTVTVVEKHSCKDFTEADCLNAAVCTVCDKENGTALGHSYTDGTCTRCGATEAVGAVTVSKTMAELITANGWTTTTTKQTFTLDDNVTVKINGGSNTGKAYNGDHIRIYATDSPAGTITISVPEGYELVSVKISAQTGTYAFLYVDGGSTDICNTTTAVSGSSVVLNSVKNGSDGKQVRVTGIEVVYQPVAG